MYADSDPRVCIGGNEDASAVAASLPPLCLRCRSSSRHTRMRTSRALSGSARAASRPGEPRSQRHWNGRRVSRSSSPPMSPRSRRRGSNVPAGRVATLRPLASSRFCRHSRSRRPPSFAAPSGCGISGRSRVSRRSRRRVWCDGSRRPPGTSSTPPTNSSNFLSATRRRSPPAGRCRPAKGAATSPWRFLTIEARA